jgi:hypothetical protein
VPVAVVGALWIFGAADVTPVAAQVTGSTTNVGGGNTVSSTGQQGGITAGSVGTIINNPPVQKTDRSAAINAVATLMLEATNITDAFESGDAKKAIR